MIRESPTPELWVRCPRYLVLFKLGRLSIVELDADFAHKSIRERFSAKQPVKFRALAYVTVIGLGDPGDGLMLDETYGLICEARRERQLVTIPLGFLDCVKDKAIRKLLNDHSYWFHNYS